MAFRAWAADENVNKAHIKRKIIIPLDIPIDQWWSEAPFAGRAAGARLPFSSAVGKGACSREAG